VGANTAFKYHEAFHAVFRMLLDNKEIQKYLDIAKKELRAQGKNIETLKKELAATKPDYYSKLSDKELEDRVYEEYLADKFDSWKMDIRTPTDAANKSFFRKLIDLIKAFFQRMTASPLENLFSDIDKGRYKNASVKTNRFTGESSMGVSQPVFKSVLIGYDYITNEEGQEERIPVYLSEKEGSKLSSTIAALFHKRHETLPITDKRSNDELIEAIMDDYADLYDPSRGYYESDEFYESVPEGDIVRVKRKLQQRFLLFTKKETKEVLKEAVNVHLKLIGYRDRLEEEDEDYKNDEYGERSTTDKRLESQTVGGFGALSKFLRQYIATATTEVVDDYGNTVFESGDPLIEAVDANTVYNGVLKAVAGLTSQYKMIQRLGILAEENAEVRSFYEKLVADTGLVIDEANESFDVTNPQGSSSLQ
jgi:hypothetical protein